MTRRHAKSGGRVLGLLVSRRFAPLFWSQFFSAFNDNLVRTMLAMMILFRMGEDHAGPLVTLAVAIFMLPAIVISGFAGEWADANDKATLACRLKLVELAVQGIAALGFWFASIPILFVALFCLGILSALYGPIKYGILPDHLSTQELTTGNALVETATFLAILTGLSMGGLTAMEGVPPLLVVALLFVVGLACYGATLFIPRTGAAAPGLRVNPNLFASTVDLLRELKADRRQWIGALGVSWFWLSGGVALSLIPVIVKHSVGAGVSTETFISVFFSVGIGLGAGLAAFLARGGITLKPVPFAALVMALFLIDLGIVTMNAPQAADTLNLRSFLVSGLGLRVTIDILGLACAGGVFSVPLFAAVQSWAAPDRRARVVAAVSVLTALFMAAGSMAFAALQSPVIGISEPVLVVALGLSNIAAAIYLLFRLPFRGARRAPTPTSRVASTPRR